MSDFISLPNKDAYNNLINKDYQDWKDATYFKKMGASRTYEGHQYLIIAKKEKHLSLFSLKRMGAIGITILTLGAAFLFSKSIRDAFHGRKVVYFGIGNSKETKSSAVYRGMTKNTSTSDVTGDKKPIAPTAQEKPVTAGVHDSPVTASEEPVVTEQEKKAATTNTATTAVGGTFTTSGNEKFTTTGENKTAASGTVTEKKGTEKPSFVIELVPRNGQSKKIETTIANVSHLSLTEENLPEIFRLANEHTVDKKYQNNDYEAFAVDGKMIYRPNHNGTHSARGTRYLEAMFDLVEKKGSVEGKKILNSLTDEEKLNLKLASYFLRAGRVDESTHKETNPDDYYTRSAQIYEAYAKQLGVNPQTIDWIKTQLIDSTKPLNKCGPDINHNPKSRFAYELLKMSHTFDLVRCYDAHHIDTVSRPSCAESLQPYLLSGAKTQIDLLFNYADKLCRATGCSITYPMGGYYPTNETLFAKCSHEGDYCWQQVRNQPIPTWA
jgi:hypothetical protein